MQTRQISEYLTRKALIHSEHLKLVFGEETTFLFYEHLS